MLTNLTPASKAASAEMKSLGMITSNGSNIFYDATGHLKSMADIQQILHDKLSKLSPAMQTFAIKTIFGQYALNGMSIIANESPAAFQKLEKSMTTAGATMDALKDREKGWAYTWKRLQAEFKTIQKEIGLALKPAVDILTTALNKLMNGWDSLSPGIKMAIIGFTGLLGVVSLLTGVFFSTVATFGFLTTGFGEGMVVLGALGTRIGTVATSIGRFATQTIPNAVKGLFTMTTAETEAGVAADSMFGIWGIVIAGVIAGVVLLITHWKQVTAWIKQNFGIDIPQTLNQLKQVFTEVWDAIKNAVDAAWNYIEPTLKQGLQALSSLWKAIWPNLRDIFTAVWDVIKVCIAAVAIPLFIEIKTELSALEASWKYIWATIGSVLKFAWDVMSGEVRIAWDILSGVIRVGLDVLNGNWGKAWNDLKMMVQNVWNDMKSLCSNAINDIKSIIVNAVHGIVAGFTGGFRGLVSAAQGVWNTIKGIFGQHISGPSVSMPSAPSPGSLHGKIPALAEGGIVSKPTLALVGEAGYPEAVVPLKNGMRADSSGISPLPRNIGSSTGNTINFHPGAIVINVPNGNANSISSALKTQIRRALQ